MRHLRDFYGAEMEPQRSRFDGESVACQPLHHGHAVQALHPTKMYKEHWGSIAFIGA